MTKGLAPVVGLTLSVLLVVGCSKGPPRAIYTENYYRTHEDFRVAKLKECEGAGDSRMTGDPDCVNAVRANKLASVN
jgi:hypothetical protein